MAFLAGAVFPELKTVTLSNAVELALQNNLDIRKTEKDLAIAQAQYGEALADFAMPTITGNASYTELDPLTVSEGIINFGNLLPSSEAKLFSGIPAITNVYPDNYHTGLAVSKTLFAGFRFWNALSIKKENLDLAKARLLDRKREVIADVTTSFYNLFLIRENIKMQEDLNRSLRDHVSFTSNSYVSGNATEYDFIRANVEYKLNIPRMTDLSNSYIDQKLLVCQEIGENDPSEVEFIGNLLDTTNTEFSVSDKTEILALSLSNDINLKAMDAGIKIAKLAKDVSQGGMYPTVGAFFNYGYDLSKTNSFAPVDRTWNSTWNAGIQLSMSFDSLIPFISKTWNNAEEAQKNIESLEVQKDILTNAVTLQVQTLLLRLEESREDMQVLLDNVNQAKLGYRLADARYKAGNSTEMEVIDAEVAVVEAEASWLKSIFEFFSSNIRLIRLTGKEA